MRPVELVFKGINSYTEEARIDFKKLHKSGIFGIFGETGAGKTTILDAITIALYSRTDRLSTISEVTNPAVGNIFVKFKFEMNGKLYEIYREYEKGTARSQVLYEYQNGKLTPIADKAREINEFIREKIIGLDFEDFTKVVILPQGKFSRFLDAGPAEKTRILAKIFGTEIFGDKLFNAVKNRRDIEKARVETLIKTLEELKDTSEDKIRDLLKERTKIKKLISQLKEEKKNTEEKLRILEKLKLLLDEKKDLENKIASLTQRQNEIDRLKEQLETAEKLLPLSVVVKSMEDAKERESQLIRNIDELDRKHRLLKPEYEAAKREWETFLSKKYPELQKKFHISLEKARTALTKQKSLEDHKKRIRSLESSINAYRKRIGEYKKVSEELQAVKEKIQRLRLLEKDEELLNIESHILYLKNSIENLNKQLESLSEKFKSEKSALQKNISKTLGESGLPEHTENPVEVLKNKLKELGKTREQKEKLLREKEHLNLATTLAQDLKDGEPCPVCGSIHHPHPSKGKIELSEIENLRKEIRELEEKERLLIRYIEKLENLLESLKVTEEKNEKEIADLTEELKKLEDEAIKLSREFQCPDLACVIEKLSKVKARRKEIENLTQIERKLTEKLQELQKSVENLKVAEAELKQLKDQMKTIQNEIDDLTEGKDPEEIITLINENLEDLDRQKERLFSKFETLKNQFEKIELSLTQNRGFLEETRRNIREYTEKLEKMASKMGMTVEALKRSILTENEIEKIKKHVQEYEKNLNELHARLKRNDEELKKLPIKELPDNEPSNTENTLHEIAEKLDKMNIRLGELERTIDEEKTRLSKKKEIEEELEEKRKLEKHLSELYSLFHGKKFSRFVARFYLSEIIREANGFLFDLTGGRLKIVGTRGDEIDFQIYDSYTGHARSTKSLSGGERFIVSFSLAISFSLYIQRRSTKSIDFFFIDEGFGTLDEDLQDAMGRVFEQIQRTGKLVGLITHVSKFRQLVPAQIIVKRDPATRSSRIEIIA